MLLTNSPVLETIKDWSNRDQRRIMDMRENLKLAHLAYTFDEIDDLFAIHRPTLEIILPENYRDIKLTETRYRNSEWRGILAITFPCRVSIPQMSIRIMQEVVPMKVSDGYRLSWPPARSSVNIPVTMPLSSFPNLVLEVLAQ